MRGEREIADLTAATQEASQLTLATGFETMTQQMRLVRRDSDEAAKYMRRAFFDEVTRDAQVTSDRLSLMFHGLLKVTPDAAKQIEAMFKTALSAGLQTDPESRQIFEEQFFAVAETRIDATDKEFNEVFKKLRTEFAEKDQRVLSLDDIEDFIISNKDQLGDNDITQLLTIALQAQGKTMELTQRIINANKDARTYMTSELSEAEANLASDRLLGNVVESSVAYKSGFNLKDEAAKKDLVARLKQAQKEDANSALKEEIGLFLKELKTVTAGTGQPTEIVFKTTGPEARAFDEMLQKLLSGIYVKRAKEGDTQWIQKILKN